MIWCARCSRRVRDGEKVVPVFTLVENRHRGDYAGNVSAEYIHLDCIPTKEN